MAVLVTRLASDCWYCQAVDAEGADKERLTKIYSRVCEFLKGSKFQVKNKVWRDLEEVEDLEDATTYNNMQQHTTMQYQSRQHNTTYNNAISRATTQHKTEQRRPTHTNTEEHRRTQDNTGQHRVSAQKQTFIGVKQKPFLVSKKNIF